MTSLVQHNKRMIKKLPISEMENPVHPRRRHGSAPL
jgi:hypothetical protein